MLTHLTQSILHATFLHLKLDVHGKFITAKKKLIGKLYRTEISVKTIHMSNSKGIHTFSCTDTHIQHTYKLWRFCHSHSDISVTRHTHYTREHQTVYGCSSCSICRSSPLFFMERSSEQPPIHWPLMNTRGTVRALVMLPRTSCTIAPSSILSNSYTLVGTPSSPNTDLAVRQDGQ